jgi:hypothetical protein
MGQKKGKTVIKWTRLSYCTFAAYAVRLQLHALASRLVNASCGCPRWSQ